MLKNITLNFLEAAMALQSPVKLHNIAERIETRSLNLPDPDARDEINEHSPHTFLTVWNKLQCSHR